jgi:hypothetical protein
MATKPDVMKRDPGNGTGRSCLPKFLFGKVVKEELALGVRVLREGAILRRDPILLRGSNPPEREQSFIGGPDLRPGRCFVDRACPIEHRCRREKPRADPGENLKGVDRPSRDGLLRCSSRPWSTDRFDLFGVRAVKVQEGRDREADLAAPGESSGEAEKPMRASARVDSGPYAGTDLRREQSLGAAGHRDLLVLRARERDAKNSMRAQAPKAYGSAGGKRSGG